jgi:CRP-like cAMP-binding protein
MLRAHDILFQQGNPAKAFYIVIDGWVKLYRLSLSGEEAVIHILTEGESFAEAVAFTGVNYPATAEAVSDTRVVGIAADHIVRCIRESPDIALAMIASTSQHLHHLVQQIEGRKAQSGVHRVAEFLASLAPVDHGSCVIALPYDKLLIAARLGVKPESLSRAFGKLRSVGVAVHATHIAISDVARLRQFAGDDRAAIRGTMRAGPPVGSRAWQSAIARQCRLDAGARTPRCGRSDASERGLRYRLFPPDDARLHLFPVPTNA